MCVISYFPAGIMLNKEELQNCMENNSNGAGVMYQKGRKVVISKGYTDFEELWGMASALPNNVDRVFHFRIATSGKIGAGCCHPFPICSDYKKMLRPELECDMAVAHNGVLTDFTPPKGLKDFRSDTMIFTKCVLNELDGGKLLYNSAVRMLLENFSTSRFAIMDKNETFLLGEFVQSEDSFAFYSNESYKKKKKYPSYYGAYGYWGEDGYKEAGYIKNYSKNGLVSANTKEIKPKKDTKISCLEDFEDGYIRIKDNKYTESDIQLIETEIEDMFKNVEAVSYNRPNQTGEILIVFSYTKNPESLIPLTFKLPSGMECKTTHYADESKKNKAVVIKK
jgi:predicted glutamine amidotransferase